MTDMPPAPTSYCQSQANFIAAQGHDVVQLHLEFQ